jgi:hypothetical protein
VEKSVSRVAERSGHLHPVNPVLNLFRWGSWFAGWTRRSSVDFYSPILGTDLTSNWRLSDLLLIETAEQLVVLVTFLLGCSNGRMNSRVCQMQLSLAYCKTTAMPWRESKLWSNRNQISEPRRLTGSGFLSPAYQQSASMKDAMGVVEYRFQSGW